MVTEPAVSPLVYELAIDATGADVRRASEWLERTCLECGVPRAATERLEVCLNEALANVATHGGGSALSAPVTLLLDVKLDGRSGTASMTISDAGMAFDPLSVPEKQSPKALEEISPGGLGLVMIRYHSDWLDYRREDGHNRLTFGTRWNVN